MLATAKNVELRCIYVLIKNKTVYKTVHTNLCAEVLYTRV